MKTLQDKLVQPKDIASLAIFRFFSGVLIFIEIVNQFFTGDIESYTEATYHFQYTGFEWVTALPSTAMWVQIIMTCLLALLVAFGLFYRISTVLLFLNYTYLFLVEKSEYVNHFYLYCLLCFVLIFLPAHRKLSLDVKRKPSLEASQVPAWCIYIIVTQMVIVYFYGGIAKLHTDWFEAKFLKIHLPSYAKISLWGDLLKNEYLPYFMAYAGLCFDLFISVGLLIRKTRKVSFIIACFFHITNATIFGLASFPWFSILLTSMFLPPSWPRKVFPFLFKQDKNIPYAYKTVPAILYGCYLYVAIQLFLPFRHYIFEKNVNWTEQHHRFSWHMMLRTKSGHCYFKVVDENNQRIHVPYAKWLHPNLKYGWVGKPDMILQLAHDIGEYAQNTLHKKGVQVYAKSKISLNGYPRCSFVNPKIDLMKISKHEHHENWVLPMKGKK